MINWFKEQVRSREQKDNINFANAIDSIANAVMGRRLQNALSENEIASSALGEILKYYHYKPNIDNLPTELKTIESQIEYIMRPYGIKSRSVVLGKGWHKNAVGPMLSTLKADGSVVALIPGRFSSYVMVDITTEKRTKITRKNEDLIDKEAVCFYSPLPLKSLNVKDLFVFMVKQLNLSDILFFFVFLCISTALGFLYPLFTKWLFGDVLQYGTFKTLISIAICMISFSICKLCFETFKSLINARVGIKQSVAVEAAVMNRVISLPPSFFKKYSAGELSQIISYTQTLCKSIFEDISISGLTSVFSLVYIGQIHMFAPTLVIPSFIIIIATIVLSLIATFIQMEVTKKRMGYSSKLSGLTYATITGIQKIKLAGAEKRMFSRWANLYANEAKLIYSPPTFLKFANTIITGISVLGTLVLYYIAIENYVTMADYYAFNAAYGMVLGAFMSVVAVATSIAGIKPMLDISKPILEAEPETHDYKINIDKLDGEIELSHVSFRYNEMMPYVIDDLSLKIKPGEYVAIVGTTGCGKSTLLRLLLGFETPQKGFIAYDKKDITKIDLESLRRKIGVVMQDGKLFLGDIYSNIVITAPELSFDRAWEAAEIASIADDIREMPMGMHTIISEGQGGISGGQKQRLMIARAVAPKPKIIMLDEATNSLDNISQKNVSDAIDTLKCTRIVIAHRLSTIQNADRIICLNRGKIIEEGKYNDLIAKNGFFAELVERQRLDINN